ncbi:hypothetical protein [Streptomyces adustus]|uniref:hypothetical protein n=1 Tax=Streptomyces adustus TaxID=1609272 RepID=UPI00371DF62D
MSNRKPSVRVAQALCAGAAATLLATASPAALATAAPTAPKPNVPCSESALFDAITAANTGGGTLVLSPGCTYALTAPLPQITNTIVINARNSTITRDSAASFGILSVGTSGNLMLSDATITNGAAPDFGGGIANHGRLTVTGSAIRDNRANFSGGIGGGSGSVTVIQRTNIMDNMANVNGGGVANDGDMTISDSRIIDNHAGATGGGAANDGTLRILRTNVNENTAGRAGGVANFTASFGTSSTTISDSNVNSNSSTLAPGGVLNTGGTVNLVNSRVRGNAPTNCAGSDVAVPNCSG